MAQVKDKDQCVKHKPDTQENNPGGMSFYPLMDQYNRLNDGWHEHNLVMRPNKNRGE